MNNLKKTRITSKSVEQSKKNISKFMSENKNKIKKIVSIEPIADIGNDTYGVEITYEVVE